jgi:hypothetical protein
MAQPAKRIIAALSLLRTVTNCSSVLHGCLAISSAKWMHIIQSSKTWIISKFLYFCSPIRVNFAQYSKSKYFPRIDLKINKELTCSKWVFCFLNFMLQRTGFYKRTKTCKGRLCFRPLYTDFMTDPAMEELTGDGTVQKGGLIFDIITFSTRLPM